MKTVGIIGGLGPGTTAEFYLDVINNAQKRYNVSRAPLVISSVPIPFDIERDLLLKNIGGKKFLPYLLAEARRLEKSDIDFIVMPCNSLHIFIREIRSEVKIPVLSIIDETVRFIQNQGIQKTGIISTAITVKNKLYENAFKTHQIGYSRPSDEDQAKLDAIILNLVMGRSNKEDYNFLIDVIKKYNDNNIKDIILACTDLQLLKPEYAEVKIYDSMKILATATVNRMLSDK